MFCFEQLAHGFEKQCYIQLRFGENSMRIERDQEEQALGKPQSTSSHIRRYEMEIFLLSVIKKGKGLLSPSVYYDLCFRIKIPPGEVVKKNVLLRSGWP